MSKLCRHFFIQSQTHKIIKQSQQSLYVSIYDSMYLYLHHNFSGVTMSYFEDVLPLFYIEQFSGKTRFFSERAGFFLENLSKSVANSDCSSSSTTDSCSDDSLALLLKFVAIASILVAGIAGVSIPLVGKDRRFLRTDSNLFVAAKAFAAGVILATGFVHMLPDATEKLTDACLPTSPWLEFPFSGFFAMFAALATLVLDVVGTQYYERKQESARQARQNARVGSVDESGIVEVCVTKSDAVVEEEEDGGIHAHGAHHRHNHDQGQEASEGKVSKHSNSHGHDHSHGFGGDDEGVRHIVVSQILELGIVSHSVIIGLSLGVSQSPCTIRPLIAALSFHQFFEGFALGGCISQAKFETLSATVMAFFFAITAPAGIGLGIAISSFYNADSARALVIEGTLDSISAGILVYMALVDLIAHDFLSNKRMKSDARLQLVSYLALFLGASLMSLLAIWA